MLSWECCLLPQWCCCCCLWHGQPVSLSRHQHLTTYYYHHKWAQNVTPLPSKYIFKISLFYLSFNFYFKRTDFRLFFHILFALSILFLYLTVIIWKSLMKKSKKLCLMLVYIKNANVALNYLCHNNMVFFCSSFDFFFMRILSFWVNILCLFCDIWIVTGCIRKFSQKIN